MLCYVMEFLPDLANRLYQQCYSTDRFLIFLQVFLKEFFHKEMLMCQRTYSEKCGFCVFLSCSSLQEKKGIRETPNLSTDAYSSTNIFFPLASKKGLIAFFCSVPRSFSDFFDPLPTPHSKAERKHKF